ncbi:ABC transporter ATP-binding protein [Candidatus Halobonum tyrrellensis]|uniref:ABC transporter n=1 Tax=Candidatus Halobonum tyrrellensis G22 TaxID=1324957 RepID=V4HPH6_9EURY|nr:ABC transporter ATP-binding protein [Candidatus Halobonum tyrrellensis]ESP89794.1 ABC transporter [Candidatus Halobonum tyrrellensis G22]
MSAIRTEGLSKYYGETRGIDDLTFAVDDGEVFGFLGPNGAGKTTAIRTLLGFQSPTAGTAEVLGADVTDERELIEARRDVGYLPAEPVFDEDTTGERALDYYGALRGDERSDHLLDLFDPPLDRKIGGYSRGNKQMLAIVVAFMHDPALLVMDEPTSGLDPLKQERFLEFLVDERDRGKTVFFSSHVLSEVQKVCERVGIIRNGRLVELEDVETLLARSGKIVRVRTADRVTVEEFSLSGVHDLSVDADRTGVGRSDGDRAGTVLSFAFTGEYNALLAQLNRYDVVDVEIEEAPLEEVFLRFYGDPASPTDAEHEGSDA